MYLTSPCSIDLVLPQVADELGHYANVEKVIWAQEEPKNSGAWFFVAPRIRTATRHFLKKVRRTPTSLLTEGILQDQPSDRYCLLF